MLALRPAQSRGHANHGWLDSWHTFSFGDYFDPDHMGFRGLRVINEDFIEPSRGFAAHPHRDMEIVTYVIDGALQHRDSIGNGSIIRPLEVQRMSAGTGITHSEYNASKSETLHLLQIWIQPKSTGIEPSYEQRTIPAESLQGGLRLIASPDGRRESISLWADAFIYATRLVAGNRVSLQLAKGRHAWVQVVCGHVSVNKCVLGTSDGAAISDAENVDIEALDEAEVLLFDLA